MACRGLANAGECAVASVAVIYPMQLSGCGRASPRALGRLHVAAQRGDL
jgi:hypothetical protein